MSYSYSSDSKAFYKFKYFPREGKWTPAMQAELDEHSRRMTKLMLYVQDQYKTKDQKERDQRKEDTDADCFVSSQQSSGFSSRTHSVSPQPIHGQFAPAQYTPAQPNSMQQFYFPVHPCPPGYPNKQCRYQF